MRRKHSILILFFLMAGVIINPGLGQSFVITEEMQYEYAQKMFQKKDYETAIIEFKRFVHFFKESKNNQKAKFNIGVCLFELKKYYDAAKNFNEIIINSTEKEMITKACLYKSRALMNAGNFGAAQLVLQNYLKLVDDQKTEDKIYFNLAMIHLEYVRKEKPGSLFIAKKYLQKISEAGTKKHHIDQMLLQIEKALKASKKNPNIAGLLSVIPGMGFLYTQRYHDAFISFLLNTGLMYAAYDSFRDDNNALGGVIAFVETGFYIGNIYGAISSAHKYNRAQTIRILNKEVLISPKIDPDKKSYELLFRHTF